jgi:hypothetical protein
MPSFCPPREASGEEKGVGNEERKMKDEELKIAHGADLSPVPALPSLIPIS